MFSVHAKTENRRFQIPPVWRDLSKGPPPSQGKDPGNEVARDGLLWTVGLTVVVIHQMFSLAHDWSKRFM